MLYRDSMNWNTRYAQESDVQPYQVTGLRPLSPKELSGRREYVPDKPIPPGIRTKNRAPDRSGLPVHEVYPFHQKWFDRMYGGKPEPQKGDLRYNSYQEEKQLLEIVKNVYKKPDALVTIRRLVNPSVGATTINPRDWASISPTWGANWFKKDGVTPRKKYEGTRAVLVKQVPASHLYTSLTREESNQQGAFGGDDVAYIPPFPKSV